MSTKSTTELIDKGKALASKASKNAKAAVNDYLTVPGFKDYEFNSECVLRSKKTGNIQQIPAGKKKYLIFNSKNQRKSIGESEILTLLIDQRKETPKAAKKTGEPKPRKVKVELTEGRIAELNAQPSIIKILTEKNKKHAKCMLLNNAGLSTDEIMAVLGTPRGATQRNIWFYTSGKKTLA